MPPTFTELLPATISNRHSAIRWTPAPTRRAGNLVIDTDRNRTQYAVSQFPTDFPGLAFHFEKQTRGTDREETGYDVFVCARSSGEHSFCTCKGFTRFSHCKHLDAAEALIANEVLWNRDDLVNGEQDVSSTEPPF
jgi:hypothetical protein